MKLSIIIESRNVGMQTPRQAAAKLRELADKLESLDTLPDKTDEFASRLGIPDTHHSGAILDHNGNGVGAWTLEK